METTHADISSHEKQLVGMSRCLEIVFPDPLSRPSFRTFAGWKSKGFLPFHKIGRRVFMCPVQVRAALDKQFLIDDANWA